MRTPLTYQLITQLSSKMIFNKILILYSLHLILYLIHQLIKKLISIHLFVDIHWISVPVFECVADSYRRDILFLRLGEGDEGAFYLVQEVVFFRDFCEFGVFNSQNRLPEGRNHEKLLQKRVHITNTPEVFQPNISRG